MEHDWKGQVAIAVVLLGIGAAVVYWFGNREQSPTALPEVGGQSSGIQAVFMCADNKSIVAAFAGREVHLTLSDGREMTIPQAISASGARFANADESFVFWNKGNTAFIEESGEMTYSTCITN